MADADISALVSSRICHDLISPVGAIGNGVELLSEIGGGGRDELELIGQSADRASATLQFYRLVFGEAAVGDPYALAACRKVAEGYFARERADLDWPAADGQVTRAAARVLGNLLMVAASTLPRGGRVSVTTRLAEGLQVVVRAAGPAFRFPPEAEAWLTGAPAETSPGPGDVHFLTAQRSLKRSGASLSVDIGAEALRFQLDVPLTV